MSSSLRASIDILRTASGRFCHECNINKRYIINDSLPIRLYVCPLLLPDGATRMSLVVTAECRGHMRATHHTQEHFISTHLAQRVCHLAHAAAPHRTSHTSYSHERHKNCNATGRQRVTHRSNSPRPTHSPRPCSHPTTPRAEKIREEEGAASNNIPPPGGGGPCPRDARRPFSFFWLVAVPSLLLPLPSLTSRPLPWRGRRGGAGRCRSCAGS